VDDSLKEILRRFSLASNHKNIYGCRWIRRECCGYSQEEKSRVSSSREELRYEFELLTFCVRLKLPDKDGKLLFFVFIE